MIYKVGDLIRYPGTIFYYGLCINRHEFYSYGPLWYGDVVDIQMYTDIFRQN
jgi:hypothetical protein